MKKLLLSLLVVSSFLQINAQKILGTSQQQKKKRGLSAVFTPPPQRLYTTHLMNALTSHGQDQQQWINYEVDSAGHNNFWLYADYWYGGSTAQSVMDAIHNAGATFMPGMQFSAVQVPNENKLSMVQQTWNHPGMYKHNGKRLYLGWDTQYLQDTVKNAMAQAGYNREDWKYVVNTRFPYDFGVHGLYLKFPVNDTTTSYRVYGGCCHVVGNWLSLPGQLRPSPVIKIDTASDYLTLTVSHTLGVSAAANSPVGMWYENYSTIPSENPVGSANHLFDILPFQGVDGVINFAVDKPGQAGTLQNIINENLATSAAQATHPNTIVIAGINADYSSAGQVDHGLEGVLSQVKAILAIRPVSNWPLGISETTANDYVERSDMSRAQNPYDPVTGFSFVPARNAGYTLGSTLSYPLLDNSAINKYIRPWIEKFKNTDTTPVTFTTDRIFYWYQLHPRTVALADGTVIPALLDSIWPAMINGIPKLQYWASTYYVTSDEKTNNIRASMPVTFDDIRMTAHLSAPAILRITIGGVDYDSPLRSGPDAAWQIPLGSKLGTPSFKLVRNGVVVKEGVGIQPITNNIYPGGFNRLTKEAKYN